MAPVRRIVVALGGNALTRANEGGTYAEQRHNADLVCRELTRLVEQGFQLVLTHGNGPQVGNLILQQEGMASQLPPMPSDVCGAMSQGQIGYMLQQTLHNLLVKRGRAVPILTLITQVIVDPHDPAFQHPTKPIGPFYERDEAVHLEARGVRVVLDSGRGYRRVVPSPMPRDIVEQDQIASLVAQGYLVIAAGGGGIPVVRDEEGCLQGVEAVVDKDAAAARLAAVVGADTLLLLTAVEQVALSFGTSRQRNLRRATIAEAKQYLAEGHFPPGSMGPKIQAAIMFLERGGERAIVTSPEKAWEAIHGRAGTEIVGVEARGSLSSRRACFA